MELFIDHQSKLPLHVQVEELLRKMISSSKFNNGVLLPKEMELANALGVSRSTIRQATNKLEYEGLLKRKKGVGTKVAQKEKPYSTELDHWYSFTQEMKERGIAVSNLLLKAGWVTPSEKLVQFFNIPAGKKVLKLSKLKGSEDGPIVYFESFFHPRIGLSPSDDFSIPLYTMLETKYSIRVARSDEHISATLANSHAARLHVPKESPILVRERFVYDPGDRPVEYNVGYYRSDKFTYSISIKATR